MLLRITDGTETALLSGGTGAGTFLGATFNPRAPKDDLTPVAEDARVVLEGASKDVIADVQKVERLLAVARASASSNVRVYVEFQREGDTLVWRSQIRDGRVLWSDDPVRRRLVSAAMAAEIVVAWERDPFWETTTELDAGTVHVVNGDGIVDALGFWIGPGGPVTYEGSVNLAEGDNARNAGEWTAIEGVLATPAHLTVTNESGGAITLRRALVANDVYAEFNGAEHLLQSGAAVSWTGSSAHSTSRWYLALSATQIAKAMAAGGVRLLAVMASVSAGLYLRATMIQQTPGPTLTEVWRGPEVLTKSGRVVYDLGAVQFPPEVATFADLYIQITIYATATGAATLDLVQLCPGSEPVALEAAALSWANGATVEWFGDRRYGEMSDYHGIVTASGRLLLQPGRANRVMVLVEGNTSVDPTAKLAVNVRYRPRRATI